MSNNIKTLILKKKSISLEIINLQKTIKEKRTELTITQNKIYRLCGHDFVFYTPASYDESHEYRCKICNEIKK